MMYDHRDLCSIRNHDHPAHNTPLTTAKLWCTHGATSRHALEGWTKGTTAHPGHQAAVEVPDVLEALPLQLGGVPAGAQARRAAMQPK